MITNAFLTISYSILHWLINILPTSTGFPQEAHTAMESLGGYLGIWSPVLPISTLATVVSFVLAVEVGIFSFKSVKWIISHIPIVGGRG